MAVPVVTPVCVRIWFMVAPDPSVAPETPDCKTVQANVVPGTLLVNTIEGAVPEQIV